MSALNARRDECSLVYKYIVVRKCGQKIWSLTEREKVTTTDESGQNDHSRREYQGSFTRTVCLYDTGTHTRISVPVHC